MPSENKGQAFTLKGLYTTETGLKILTNNKHANKQTVVYSVRFIFDLNLKMTEFGGILISFNILNPT